MQFSFKRFLPHLLVLVGFVVLSLAYFNPVLQGKKIFQSDIMHHIGMAEQHKDFAKNTGEDTYWTNSAFGGMPTYLLGAKYPNNYIKKLDLAVRFLPRPADYMFLYLTCFYILLLVLKVDYKLAALGAVAFGLSTYLIIILGVGHNSKAHAIAYMPLVLAGIILTFNRKYIFGFLLTAIALGLQIVANHFQMTYYLLITVIIMGIIYLKDYYKKGNLPHFFKSVVILSIAAMFAVGLNSTSMLATKDYVSESTRGKSPLTINPDKTLKEKTSGLSRDYITQYSYGVGETFNLFIPNFMGGGTYEDLGKDSETYKAYINIGASPMEALQAVKQSPVYWGEQPIVEGPAYVGAVVIFLFVFALFLIKGRLKWWTLGATILALLLSYGKNFGLLTDFFIDYVPFYNKFRAVSSMQVILEMCLPILAVVGLSKLFYDDKISSEDKLKALKYSVIITIGSALILLLFKSTFFNFSGIRDGQYRQAYGPQFIDALIKDRKHLYTIDTIRSIVFVGLAAALIFLYLKQKLKHTAVIALFFVVLMTDLIGVGRRYVNEDSFTQALRVDKPYQAHAVDREILKDKSHFRVIDFTREAEQMPAKASYYHNSLFGYHAAKPGRYNELLEFYIYENNLNVLNMLNTKYIIAEDEGKVFKYKNTEANGNAWFISEIIEVENEDEEILALDTLNNKLNAVIPKHLVAEQPLKTKYSIDSLAQITLKTYKPNHLEYATNNSNDGFAVFSEVYYKNGWNAYIDGNLVPHHRVNYVLRGLEIPKGKHKVTFKFEPQLVKTGGMISLASSAILGVLLLVGIFYSFKNEKD